MCNLKFDPQIRFKPLTVGHDFLPTCARAVVSLAQLAYNYPNSASAFFHSSLKWKFVAEFVCLNLQPMPFVSNVTTAAAASYGHYGFTYKFMPLMFLRLYLVLRCVHDFSALYRNRYRILHEIRESDPNWVLDFTTVMKTYFNANAFMVRCVLDDILSTLTSSGVFIMVTLSRMFLSFLLVSLLSLSAWSRSQSVSFSPPATASTCSSARWSFAPPRSPTARRSTRTTSPQITRSAPRRTASLRLAKCPMRSGLRP
jgi:hypothetical protein